VTTSSWDELTSTFSVPPRTTVVFVSMRAVEEQVALLIDDIVALVENGELKHKEGKALIKKLVNALKMFEKGNTKAAINQLKSFIKKVRSFVKKGRLSAGQGAALIAAAEGIIASTTA